ncbi:NAD(P)/FAD-dependent oxidoreductase [Taibaiella lutea]|uniref:NAD(P)/FAD-dependent oxidoreductase n=1 Tax=Taibaiella lutea TaxID=2608001 RepID=A0A5M6CQL8_9BACT|nr:NAD(P)/FAD-dependent oxidoreductase [Taibaiella lutea]KAA5536680.1 NAD(P)/FAD-dependent oxidoreductase [Taibaiella lutea]
MNEYDVVIAGSGLGGLLSAVMLAKEGMRVAVIEQHKQIGGCLQTFSFRKKIFDSCVHYIGALDKGQTQYRIFSYAGIMPDLKLKRLNRDGFDTVLFDDDAGSYPLAQGIEHFKASLSSYFKDSKEELDAYLKVMQDTCNSFPLYNLRNGDASEKAGVSGLSLDDVMLQIKDEKLRNVLLGNSLLYAGSHSTTPFYVHALVSKSYLDSAYKCEGGSSQISKLLWKQLQSLGGVVYRNEKILKLIEKDGRIVEAVAENGNRYTGRHFIANMHPATVMNLIESKMIKPVYRNRIKGAVNSISAFMMNIVLKPGTVVHPDRNYYWNRSGDSLAAIHYRPEEWPANYALYFNEDKHCPGFAETVSILTYMHVDEMKQWENTTNSAAKPEKRTRGYELFKNQKAHLLLGHVAKRFPEIKENLLSFQTASPLTFRDYMGSPDGSIYGIMADVKHAEKTSIPFRTKIPNLMLVGQNIGLHGVLGVSINAIAVCGELIGLDYLLEKINKTSV